MNLYLAGGITGNLQPDWKCVYTSQAHTLRGGGGGDDLPFLSGSYTRPYVLEGLAPRCNILESFYYIKPWQAELIPRFKSFMLDSGAFTMLYGKGKVDIWDYARKYSDFINEYDVGLFFELDVDSITGYQTVLDLRSYVEKETGKKVIPVWHLERGLEEYERMIGEYEYCSIGGIAVKDGRARLEKYLPALIGKARESGVKLHGLGYTEIEKLRTIGFTSVDSTAWLYGNRGGYIYRFNGRTIAKVNTPKGKKLNSKSAAIHNFKEWVRFAEYLERV